MPSQAKNNKLQHNDCLEGVKTNSLRQTKLSREYKKKENFPENDSEAVQGRQKLMNKFYKRVKRTGIWFLSFVSSFLCGAFVVFILW